MAEGPSPYLRAIQKVVGNTPGKKFYKLNRIVKRIIESDNQNASMQSAVDSSELPEALKPLVQVEVARLSEQFVGICEALKSDDSLVFDRALRAKWFFNGSHRNCRVQYYKKRIFPVVSLQSRLKIIRALANNLTANPAIAEAFYTSLILKYEEKQAHPLLKACSESFIWRHITNHKLRLNNKMVRILFDKYPKLVVKYLKLSKKSDDEFERNLRPVNLQSHASLLPRLFNKYPDTFMELIEMHNNNFNIKLSRRSTNLFFKKFPDALIRNPRLFLPMLDLKVVYKNITDLQFLVIFKQLFPPKIDSFEFDELLQYLECLSNDAKLHLMTSTFEEVYGVKFLDCTEKITPSALSMLPPEDRIKAVRIILKDIEQNSPKSPNMPWIGYLPPDPLIEMTTSILERTTTPERRADLIKQLIFTCRVNANNDSFLRVINHIAANHMDEPDWFFMDIFEYISIIYPINTLTEQHWNAFIPLIVATSNKFPTLHEQIPLDLIIAAIRCDLDRRITQNTGTMKFFTKLNLTRKRTDWRIFEDNFRYDRICLEHFITNVLTADSSSKSVPDNPLIHLLASIKDFNDEVTEVESEVKVIRIEEYPKLVERVQPLIDRHVGNRSFIRNLKVAVRNLDQNLYNRWVSKSVRKCEKLPQVIISDLNSRHTWIMLKTDPQCVNYYWEEILKECIEKNHSVCGKCKSCSESDPLARRFVRMSRWCQDLPINFLGKLSENVDWHKKGRDLLILALLLEGPELERFVKTSITAAITRITDENNAEDGLKLTYFIPRALSVANPPVSLDFMVNYCVDNCKQVPIEYILNIGRRTACSKVISFATDLLKPRPIALPVSIRKIGIQLLCMVQDAESLHDTLKDLWYREMNPKLRGLLFRNVLKLFKSFPNDQNWRLIKRYISGLTRYDRDTFRSLMKFDSIPNEYIAKYVDKLFALFLRLGNKGNDLEPEVVWLYFTKILSIDKNILALCPDTYHRNMIATFVLDFGPPKGVQSAAQIYLINYILIARDKLEDGLTIFENIFKKMVKHYWNIHHRDDPTFYPAKHFVHELIYNILYSLPDSPIKRKLVNIVMTVAQNSDFNAYRDPEFYTAFTVASCVNDKIYPQELVTKIKKLLPVLEKCADYVSVETIAECLYKIFDSVTTLLYQVQVIINLLGLRNDYADDLAFHLIRRQRRLKNYPRLAEFASRAIP
ncbi:uncharacterized protein LOC130675116 [Microplitis mediator]|uniref:uncharacterized protein LOC130675116 n=1 Tax=Microplitis mediator TaxID=375433 RepID=UPI002555129A|nr:uncharacterized protein LOC130675116 [Microplitis mediator]